MAFTKENAGIYSKMALTARWSNRMPREPKQNGMVLRETITGDATEQFRTETLMRVREEIKSTLDKLKDEDGDLEAIDRERLSRSLGVLLEHEGHLSGRPKSGVLKPSSKPTRQVAIHEPTPVPVAISQPEPVSVNAPKVEVSGDWQTTLF